MLAGYAAFWAFTLRRCAAAANHAGRRAAGFRPELAAVPLRAPSAARPHARPGQARGGLHPLHVRPAVRAAGRGAGGMDRHRSHLQLSVHPRAHLRHRHGGQPADRADRRAGAVCCRFRVPALFATLVAPCAPLLPARIPRRWSASTSGTTARWHSPPAVRSRRRRHTAVLVHRHQSDHRRCVHRQGADRHRHGRHRPRAGRPDRRADPRAWRRPWRRCCSIPASSPSSTSRSSPSCCCGARRACSAAAAEPERPLRVPKYAPAHRRTGRAAVRAVLRQHLLAVARHQHPDLHRARHRLGLLLGPDPIRVARRLGLLRHRRLRHRGPRARLFLSCRPAGRRRDRHSCSPPSSASPPCGSRACTSSSSPSASPRSSAPR